MNTELKTSVSRVLSSIFMWLSFPECLALATGIRVALKVGIGGSATPEYSLHDFLDYFVFHFTM